MNDSFFLVEYPSRFEAKEIEAILKVNGIKCLLQSNDVGDALMGGFAVTEGPTNIFVQKEDLGKAKELVNSLSDK